MLSERIKKLRKEKHWNQKEMADRLSISQQTVGSWETGRTEPNTDYQIKLAKIFDVSVDYLLGNSTDRQEVDLDKPGAILRYNGRPIPPDDLEVIKRILRSVEHGDK